MRVLHPWPFAGTFHYIQVNTNCVFHELCASAQRISMRFYRPSSRSSSSWRRAAAFWIFSS